jgi:hypothetical protein
MYTHIQKDVHTYRHTDSMHAYSEDRNGPVRLARFGFGHLAGGAEQMHVYMGACMCVNTYIHTYIHIYIHTYRKTYRHTDIQRHSDTDMHTFIQTYMYIKI